MCEVHLSSVHYDEKVVLLAYKLETLNIATGTFRDILNVNEVPECSGLSAPKANFAIHAAESNI